MFKKNKSEPEGIPVMHYSGIDTFAPNFPVKLNITDDMVIITRMQPETIVSLPLCRVKSFSTMEEKNFMLKYHGQAIRTSKARSIKKYYLIIEYDKGEIILWGTASQWGYFRELQYNTPNAPKQIDL